MKTLSLFLLLVGIASADTVSLFNSTASDRVMIAQGATSAVAVDVPAGVTVEVEVGRLPLSFDFENALAAFGAGFFLVFPFGVWRAARGIFNDAD